MSRKRQLASAPIPPPPSTAPIPPPSIPSTSTLPFEIPTTTKRRKLNPGVDLLRAFGAANLDLNANLAATPVASEYSLQVVVDGLMKTFETVPEAVLQRGIEMVRMVLPPSELRKGEEEESSSATPTTVAPTMTSTAANAGMNGASSRMEVATEPRKEEESVKMVDPLKLDLGEEELSIKAEVPPEPIVRPISPSDMLSVAKSFLFLSLKPEPEPEESTEDATLALSAALLAGSASADFDLEPLDLSSTAKHSLIYSTLKRICSAGSDGGVNERIWIPLVSRLITRGLESGVILLGDQNESEQEQEVRRKRGERLREILFSYVTRDLQAR